MTPKGQDAWLDGRIHQLEGFFKDQDYKLLTGMRKKRAKALSEKVKIGGETISSRAALVVPLYQVAWADGLLHETDKAYLDGFVNEIGATRKEKSLLQALLANSLSPEEYSRVLYKIRETINHLDILWAARVRERISQCGARICGSSQSGEVDVFTRKRGVLNSLDRELNTNALEMFFFQRFLQAIPAASRSFELIGSCIRLLGGLDTVGSPASMEVPKGSILRVVGVRPATDYLSTGKFLWLLVEGDCVDGHVMIPFPGRNYVLVS